MNCLSRWDDFNGCFSWNWSTRPTCSKSRKTNNFIWFTVMITTGCDCGSAGWIILHSRLDCRLSEWIIYDSSVHNIDVYIILIYDTYVGYNLHLNIMYFIYFFHFFSCGNVMVRCMMPHVPGSRMFTENFLLLAVADIVIITPRYVNKKCHSDITFNHRPLKK